MPPADRQVEGAVDMMLDATHRFDGELTAERLFSWHASLFPTGRNNRKKIIVGAWRDVSAGTMLIVSNADGRERVHFEAPAAERLDGEMSRFLDWCSADAELDPIIRAALAHLWFVTVHPFEDGNGRIGRAISETLLARSDRTSLRFYAMSAQIYSQRQRYYEELEKAQKSDLNISAWILWFLACLSQAIRRADRTIA
ncbi:Fic family protein [Bradyrhizobium sp. CCGB20]|uniref:Fic family protein n=1 Tax=Bradyrhizobium sp. CCGB20 TaxID=2949633 RepID=UPI0020B3F4BF|nr:Fic family protein [Bradyrhizobium sp. CCGB20]MCP3400202.1 Fic family protein [Bradyrhizobium sp. CCGB20]